MFSTFLRLVNQSGLYETNPRNIFSTRKRLVIGMAAITFLLRVWQQERICRTVWTPCANITQSCQTTDCRVVQSYLVFQIWIGHRLGESEAKKYLTVPLGSCTLKCVWFGVFFYIIDACSPPAGAGHLRAFHHGSHDWLVLLLWSPTVLGTVFSWEKVYRRNHLPHDHTQKGNWNLKCWTSHCLKSGIVALITICFPLKFRVLCLKSLVSQIMPKEWRKDE